jgi:hypothetical protein
MAHGRNIPSDAKAVINRQSRRFIQLHAVVQEFFDSSASRASTAS